jgi:hypothetical protein
MKSKKAECAQLEDDVAGEGDDRSKLILAGCFPAATSQALDELNH